MATLTSGLFNSIPNLEYKMSSAGFKVCKVSPYTIMVEPDEGVVLRDFIIILGRVLDEEIYSIGLIEERNEIEPDFR